MASYSGMIDIRGGGGRLLRVSLNSRQCNGGGIDDDGFTFGLNTNLITVFQDGGIETFSIPFHLRAIPYTLIVQVKNGTFRWGIGGIEDNVPFVSPVSVPAG